MPHATCYTPPPHPSGICRVVSCSESAVTGGGAEATDIATGGDPPPGRSHTTLVA